MYLASSESGRLRGTMNDTHLVLTRWPSVQDVLVDARMQEGTLAGTWTARGAPPRSFSATPLVLGAKEAELDEAYDGVLGNTLEIHVKIKRHGTSLTGRYSYAGRSEELRLEGTIQDAGGVFLLRELNAKGTETGTWRGVLLDTKAAFGRWTPASAGLLLTFVLRGEGLPREPAQEEPDSKAVSPPSSAQVAPPDAGPVSPPNGATVARRGDGPMSLPNGATVTPQQVQTERKRDCSWSISYPQVTGMANAATQATLDGALLKVLSEPQKYDLEYNCGGVSYEVSAMTSEAFAIRTTKFQWSSQVPRPMESDACYVADLDKGTVTKTVAKLLSAAARAKVEAIAKKELKDDIDDSPPSVVSDTTALCVDRDQLVISFNQFGEAFFARGNMTVPIARADAQPLVKGTVLEPFFR
jgi:hypothetical protein